MTDLTSIYLSQCDDWARPVLSNTPLLMFSNQQKKLLVCIDNNWYSMDGTLSNNTVLTVPTKTDLIAESSTPVIIPLSEPINETDEAIKSKCTIQWSSVNSVTKTNTELTLNVTAQEFAAGWKPELLIEPLLMSSGNYSKKLSTRQLRIVLPLTSIELNKTTSSLSIGSTEQLTVTFTPDNATNKNITWTSSDETKATVVDGLVTAIAEGVVTITTTSDYGSLTASCNYTVSAS